MPIIFEKKHESSYFSTFWTKTVVSLPFPPVISPGGVRTEQLVSGLILSFCVKK